MESRVKALKVRDMVNKVILTLIGKQYKIPDGNLNIPTFEDGIKRINERLYPYSRMADERIVDYVVYYLYLKRAPKYHFTEHDMFGDWAIEKYRRQFMSEEGKSGINYYIDQWLDEGDLNRGMLTSMIAEPQKSKLLGLVYMPSEELIKRRFYNTENGLLLCQQSTTGFAPRSEACRECKNVDECKFQTKKRFPELFRLRIKDYKNYGKEK